MKRIASLFRGFVSVLMVMVGVYLMNFYVTNELSILSVLLGIVGFIILHPAVKKWDEIFWGKKEDTK